MEIWHESAGEGGPTVLLVHAGICDSRMWDPQWETLTARRRTVRVDLRGFGRTPLPPEPFSHGADLVELIERIDRGPVALVGASFGGLQAIDVAVARPDLVERLLLVSPALAGHEWSDEIRRYFEEEEDALGSDDLERAVELNLRTWVDGPAREPGEVDPELRRGVGAMQRHAFELQLPAWELAGDELLVEDLATRYREVAAPTMVVVGEGDVADMHAIADRIVEGVADARLETVAAAAHLPSLERPEDFDRIALEFLA